MGSMTPAAESAWPFDGLRLQHRQVELRPVTEADLPVLVALQPDDHEHDPTVERFPFHTRDQHRTRLVHRDYWQSRGTWTPTSWALGFVVRVDGDPVGVQSLEATDFPTLRTVDSGSWLSPEVRGRGIGVDMRLAVLGLAFDHLGAVAAISSARVDNHASLGVSLRCGYLPNGVSLTDSEVGPVELQHLRLTASAWANSDHAGQVEVDGLGPGLAWFGAARQAPQS